MIIELRPPDTSRAFEAMRELRPSLPSREDFVQRIDGLQRPSGYRLAAAFSDGADDGEPAVAVAGFRVGENLAWGRHLYVDDLSTVPAARGRGYAGALLDWLHDEARAAGCAEVHLDSGVGPDRTAAHRLYFAQGYRISSHHFAREL